MATADINKNREPPIIPDHIRITRCFGLELDPVLPLGFEAGEEGIRAGWANGGVETRTGGSIGVGEGLGGSIGKGEGAKDSDGEEN